VVLPAATQIRFATQCPLPWALETNCAHARPKANKNVPFSNAGKTFRPIKDAPGMDREPLMLLELQFQPCRPHHLC
jgi:hypothetical protein